MKFFLYACRSLKSLYYMVNRIVVVSYSEVFTEYFQFGVYLFNGRFILVNKLVKSRLFIQMSCKIGIPDVL